MDFFRTLFIEALWVKKNGLELNTIVVKELVDSDTVEKANNFLNKSLNKIKKSINKKYRKESKKTKTTTYYMMNVARKPQKYSKQTHYQVQTEKYKTLYSKRQYLPQDISDYLENFKKR